MDEKIDVQKEQEEIKKKGYAKVFWGKTAEFIDNLKAPLRFRAIKRQMKSAWDDANGKIIDLELKLHNKRADLKNFDINAINQINDEIEVLKKVQEMIKKEYQEAFAKPMKIEEDDED